jgi:hypothetical protein
VKGLKIIQKLYPEIDSVYISYFHDAVRYGRRDIAAAILDPMIKNQNYGFNHLHLKALTQDDKLGDFHRANVIKKSNTNNDITPVHCACINPNVNILKELVNANSEALSLIDR